MAKAVLFDAGNTLVFVEPQRALEVLAPFGASTDAEVFRDAERAARLRLVRSLAGTAPLPEPAAWKGYFGALLTGLGIPREAAREAGRAMLAAHEADHMWTRIDPRTPEALDRLRRAGYRLGVVSNADGRMPEVIDTVGLRGYFEFVVDSHRVGVAKPDARIFRIAVERMGLVPGDCVYVGDLHAVDVVGSRGAGLEPVLLDPFDAYEGLVLGVDRIADVAALPDWLDGR